METKTKKCSKCGEEKPATHEFYYKNASAKDGLCLYCRFCEKERCRLANAQKRQDPNEREKHNQASLDWAKENPDKACARAIARHAYRIEANPCHSSKPDSVAWNASEAPKIALIYQQASENGLEVDHIDPLRPSEALPAWAKPLAQAAKLLPEPIGAHHKFKVRYGLICGLHVSANLQLLSQYENGSKSNKFNPYRLTDGQLFYLSKDGKHWEPALS